MQPTSNPILSNKYVNFDLISYLCSFLQDVAYKPEELFARTHKCESDAGADVVQACER